MTFGSPITKLSQLVQDIITGALIRTAASGPRWQITGSAQSTEINGYTGAASETSPHQINFAGTLIAYVSAMLNTSAHSHPASMTLDGDGNAAHESVATFNGDILRFNPGQSGNLQFGADENGFKFSFAGFGRAFKAIDFGDFSGTTNAAGTITIPHSLGVVPTEVLTGPGNAGGGVRIARCDTFTATDFACTFLTSAGAIPAVGTPVNTRFIAIK